MRTCSLTKVYGFERPNDQRGLNLINSAATAVLKHIPDISIAYGVSDELRFVLFTAEKVQSG